MSSPGFRRIRRNRDPRPARRAFVLEPQGCDVVKLSTKHLRFGGEVDERPLQQSLLPRARASGFSNTILIRYRLQHALLTAHVRAQVTLIVGERPCPQPVLRSDTVRELVPPARPSNLADMFNHLSTIDLLAGYEAASRFYEIDSPGGLADLDDLLGDRSR